MTVVTIIMTPREKSLYDALVNNEGGWVSREGLAEQTDKRQLSVHDHRLLERMEEKGLIVSEIRPGKGLGKYFYRLALEVVNE